MIRALYEAVSDWRQRIGLIALLIVSGMLFAGHGGLFGLIGLFVATFASSRYVWHQIRLHRKDRATALLANTIVPLLVIAFCLLLFLLNRSLLMAR